MAVTVREYETADGKVPFRDWLATLDRATRARVQVRAFFGSRRATWATTTASGAG